MNMRQVLFKEINETKRESDEEGVRAKYRCLTETLIEKKVTITTMESCTSGQLASLITDTEGSALRKYSKEHS